jgi:D-arabinose 1-dehydrogenase-like Zn-dependent alcohol dehydrogenase
MANINQADLESMSYLLEAGRIVPAIGQIYSLEEVPQAIRYVESGHASGKVVISI